MAERIGAGLVDQLHHPGVYRGLGAAAADASKEMDPRIRQWVNDGSIAPVEAQQVSDGQPHAISLRALAARVDRREKVFVSPWRVIDLLVTPEHDGPVRVADLAGADLSEWLKTMCQNRDPEISPRPAVVVGADDTVRPAPFGSQAAW
ncbi:hypothetical protein [Mycobacterium sp.]|uniref:hypothetical protein n=1 Tax=Mycobacterium sp. TaxID=1785 RepID=UPI003C731546